MQSMSGNSLLHSLIFWVLNAAALMLTSNLIKGMYISGFTAALMASLVLAAANYFLLPLLTILTLPLTVITLGLFWFFLYGAMLKIAAAVIPGFAIQGWLPAIVGALILTAIQWLFRMVFRIFVAV